MATERIWDTTDPFQIVEFSEGKQHNEWTERGKE